MPKGARPPTSTARVAKEMKQSEALKMRRDGKSYDEIGKALDVHQVTAYRYIKTALAELDGEDRETAEEVRRLESLRLDQLTEKYLALAIDGDRDAATTVLKIMDRRAKMLGIDLAGQEAPLTTVEIEGVDLVRVGSGPSTH